jgi:L-rhamnose mutarotase
MVIELKEKHVAEYIEIHRNAWPEMLKAIELAGTNEEIIYNYRNLSIVFFSCEDTIDEVFARLGEKEVVARWNEKVGPWFAKAGVVYPEKIFDLRQQLSGKLEPL